jgi:hypothetical protein
MLALASLYAVVLPWMQALGITPTAQPAAAVSVAQRVTALLLAQSLRPSALLRALVSRPGVPARQRYKRVARAWTRRWLSSAVLSPALVRAAVQLVPPQRTGTRLAGRTVLALDSVRCGRWEVFVLGVVWHGRLLPVGWQVLPYPWPKGQFTPTVCALVQQVAAVWPAERSAVLVADRAFCSWALVWTLRVARWDYVLRLQARSWVTVEGTVGPVRERLAQDEARFWQHTHGAYGGGPRALPGQLVYGRGLLVLPTHQTGPASLKHRAAQWQERQRHAATKHPGRTDASAQTAGWVVLFTSLPTVLAATTAYAQRWAIEGSFRDAQGGWDGRHGWDLEPTLAQARTASQVDRVVGLWALGTLLQTWLGAQTRTTTTPEAVRGVVRGWTTTGRLSVWAAGRLALTDPSGTLQPWLTDTLTAGAARLTPPPPSVPTSQAAA